MSLPEATRICCFPRSASNTRCVAWSTRHSASTCFPCCVLSLLCSSCYRCGGAALPAPLVSLATCAHWSCAHQLQERTGGPSFWEAHTRHRGREGVTRVSFAPPVQLPTCDCQGLLGAVKFTGDCGPSNVHPFLPPPHPHTPASPVVGGPSVIPAPADHGVPCGCGPAHPRPRGEGQQDRGPGPGTRRGFFECRGPLWGCVGLCGDG